MVFSLFSPAHALALPAFDEVRDSHKKTDAVLLDRHGRVIHELRVDSKGRRLDWVSVGDVSPALIKAVLQSEDRRFYEHSGVDWKALGSAAIWNIFSHNARGASTITMQVASMLDASLKGKGAKKTLGQKWDQIRLARGIERSWTKNQVLEAYLNLVTFRGELQGIAAASRGLFGKEQSGLDEAESFILASLIRSPNASAGDVIRRACILKRSAEANTGCTDIEALGRKTLTGVYAVRQKAALAPHVARVLLREERTSAVSTLDGYLQHFAAGVLRRHLAAVRAQNVRDGAVLVVENRTGDVLAYIGGAGEEASARYVDGVQARRQAGSTLKPFLYATAFEKRILTPASMINDGPLDVPTASGIYKPGDYEGDFKGLVSARTALASSLNIPAVRVLMLTGTENFILKLRQLGFDQLREDDYYGPSLALGAADVTLWELVAAYRTLAEGGMKSGLKLGQEKTNGGRHRVFSEKAAFLVSDILSDREARSTTFNLENPLSTRFWTAVKTGTSKDMRDNWCIGYSGRYTVGVWVGNFGGQPMWNVSGVTGAAPVWLEIMNRLHRHVKGTPPGPPSGLAAVNTEFPDRLERPRTEWFIKGTEPSSMTSGRAPVVLNTQYERPQIVYPSDGTVIAMDPDIPEEYSLLFFEAENGGGEFSWMLNSEKIGAFGKTVAWNPRPGKYLLSLVDKENRVVDSVKFEVRGAMPVKQQEVFRANEELW